MKQIGRRKFLKYSGGLAGLLLLGGGFRLPFIKSPFSLKEKPEKPAGKDTPRRLDGLGTVPDEKNRFGMVIDVGACIGCRRCMWACKAENNTPDTISPFWIEVFEVKAGVDVNGNPSPEDLKKGTTTSYIKSPLEGRWYLPAQCNHCDNAPCVKVCPTGATFKDKDGLVLMDYDKCIGCRLCVVACPYSARRFNWFQGEVPEDKVNPLVPVRPVGVPEKCTFCVHRVREGRLPACVEACPVRARHFGDADDPNSEISRLQQSNLTFRLLEEYNTEPNIRYITRGKKWTKG